MLSFLVKCFALVVQRPTFAGTNTPKKLNVNHVSMIFLRNKRKMNQKIKKSIIYLGPMTLTIMIRRENGKKARDFNYAINYNAQEKT